MVLEKTEGMLAFGGSKYACTAGSCQSTRDATQLNQLKNVENKSLE